MGRHNGRGTDGKLPDVMVAREAERAVVGACLGFPDAYFLVAGSISASDFHVESYRIAWRAIERLGREGGGIDLVTVWETIRANGWHNGNGRGGGISFADLGEWAASVPTRAYASHYAAQVAGSAARRRLLAVASQVAAKAGDPDVDDPVSEAFGLMLDMEQGGGQEAGVVSSGRAWSDYLATVSARGGHAPGYMTGYHDLDDITGGFRPSDMVVIAGRPSVGKTTLAENLADAFLARNRRVMVASLEMPVERLLDRKATRLSGKNIRAIEAGKHLDEVTYLAGRCAEETITYLDDPNLTTDRLLAAAYRQKMQSGLDIVIVDYLQLLKDDLRLDNDVLRTTRISGRLKLIARKLDIAMLVLSQLSRGVESRSDKRPMLSDLRQSGAIEQDADVAMLLYREWLYDKSAPPNDTEVHVAKNRNGATGVCHLWFIPSQYKFENAGNDRQAAGPVNW